MSAIVIGGWGDLPNMPAHHIKMANEIAKLAPSDRRTDRIRERLHAALKASKTSAARDAIHQVLFTTRDNTLRERPSMVAQLRRLVATLPALAILALPIIAHAAPDCAADAEMVDATCYPGDLQSAINQAISSDRPLLLPRGTYPTNQTLTIDYAPTSSRGFELISHGAIIDGNAITHGPVLLITCSGGTPANPKGCFHFHQEGTLFVDGHADNRTVRVGNFDYSDAHNSMVWDHLVVNNGGSGGIALSLQYVLNMSAYVVADSAGAAGIEISQAQFSTIRGAATGAQGAAITIGPDYNFGNHLDALDLEASPICLAVTPGNAGTNTLTDGTLQCPTPISDPQGHIQAAGQ